MLTLSRLRREGVERDGGRQRRVDDVVGKVSLHNFIPEGWRIDFPGFWFKDHECVQFRRRITAAEYPVAKFDQVFRFVQLEDGLRLLSAFASPGFAVGSVHNRNASKFLKCHIKQ